MIIRAIATASGSTSAFETLDSTRLTSSAVRRVINAIPVPRGSTVTMRSRRLSVSLPRPAIPDSAIAALMTR